MTDKDRLEVIDYQKDIDTDGFVILDYEDYKLLYEKANHVFMYEVAAEKANAVIEQTNEENIALRERVWELERSNKQIKRNIGIYQSINEDAVEKNKRYCESIKKAISYFNYDEHQRGMAELQKALGEF